MPEPSPSARGLRVPAAFAACTLIWGSTFLFIRIGNETVPPLWGATLRLVLASALLVPLAHLTGGLPRGAALRTAWIYGVLTFGLNMGLLYWGETAVSSGLAAVVYATTPLTSALIARAFGLERLAGTKLAGAVIALGGVAVLFAHDLHARVTALPLLAIFAATVFAALGSTLFKRGPHQSAIGANAVGSLAAIPVCLAASLLLGERHPWPLVGVQLYPILYLAVAGTAAFVVFAWLVQRVAVSSAAFVGVVVPVIAVALGAAVRGERLGVTHALGSVLVLAGVAVAVIGDRRRPGQTPAAAR